MAECLMVALVSAGCRHYFFNSFTISLAALVRLYGQSRARHRNQPVVAALSPHLCSITKTEMDPHVQIAGWGTLRHRREDREGGHLMC